MKPGGLSLHGDAFEQPGIRLYLFVGLGALGLNWLLLLERAAFGGLALMPFLLGLLGLLPYLIPAHWGVISRTLRRPFPTMPVLVLVSVTAIEFLFGEVPLSGSAASVAVDDLLVVLSLLTYSAAQYRLLSMGYQWLPQDSRPRPGRIGGDPPELLPNGTDSGRELRDLAWIAVGSLLAGVLLWSVIAVETISPEELQADQLRLPRTARRILVAVWLLGGGIILARQAFRLVRYYSFTADEARRILRDELWWETRSEQRRAARWLAWLRRRRESPREASP